MPIAQDFLPCRDSSGFNRTRKAILATVAGIVLCSRPGRSPAQDVPPKDVLVAGHLTCEYLTDPLGIDEPAPRLAWKLADDRRGVSQSAYEIAVASTEKGLSADHPDLWDSGKVTSAETDQIEYHGKPLPSRQQCFWHVRAWDQTGKAGPWSEAARWEMGLLSPADWHAKWIAGTSKSSKEIKIISAVYETTDEKITKDVTKIVQSKIHDNELNISVKNDDLGGDPADHKKKQLKIHYTIAGESVEKTLKEDAPLDIPPRPIPALRDTFHVDGPVTKARLYVTAFGLYDISLNGTQVGNHILAPDWTDYKKRLRYQAYDVTAQIKSGDNDITGLIANGWYGGHIGNGGFHYWGDHPLLMAQLEITHEDGTVQQIVTDDKWKSHASPIMATDFMLGEDYDAQVQVPTGGDLDEANGWTPVKVETPKVPQLDAQVDQPVTELMTLKPKSLNEPTPGHWLFDIGQNMVGVARIKVNAPAGTKITIRFAEMLNGDKTIYTANYRGAPSIDNYICKGTSEEVWQPRFTFHGFRYVELTGLPAKPDLDAVTGVVLGTNMPWVGQFTCSDPRINQLQSNIQWGQRGNYLSVPTDCPQRDERLGWMGDAQVFVGTGVYNADISAFFSKWMVDVDDAQTADGQFTNVSPDNGAGSGTPGWGDAGVICPWTIYHTYGDKRELARHLPAMMRWVDYCEKNTDHQIRDKGLGSKFGDWLNIKAKTPDALIGTAYFAHVTDLVAKSAKVCGDNAAAKKYGDLFTQIKAAFVAKYVDKEGAITSGTQASYAMALQFNLLPNNLREKAAQHLADDVRAKGNHLSTGFLGVSYLLPALSNNGHPDLAYRLLMQDTFPSWLFSVGHGATTIWERWDGWTPEKGFQDPGMNSFNHYSLGSCGQWLYESVAGISQTADGDSFKHIIIHPHIGGGLTYASAKYDSARGLIESGWKVDNDRLTMTVTIPPNTSATVRVPTTDPAGVTEGGKHAASAEGVKSVRKGNGAATIEIGSGTYVFEAPAPAPEKPEMPVTTQPATAEKP